MYLLYHLVGPVNDNLTRVGETFDELCREGGVPVRSDFATGADYERARREPWSG